MNFFNLGSANTPSTSLFGTSTSSSSTTASISNAKENCKFSVTEDDVTEENEHEDTHRSSLGTLAASNFRSENETSTINGEDTN
jgi:hypothetical protein